MFLNEIFIDMEKCIIYSLISLSYVFKWNIYRAAEMLALDGATYITEIFLFSLKQQAIRQKISQLHSYAGRILQCRNPNYRWSLVNAVAGLLS